MIKKLVSVSLVAVMILSMLTGCGVSELGYLKLSKEVGSLTQFSFNNSTQIEISEEAAGEKYSADMDLDGVVNIDELQSMYMAFDLAFKFNEIEVEEPIKFKISENKLYVSKNSILEVVAYENLLNGTSDSKEIIEELYSNDLENIEYILLANLNELYGIDYEVNYIDLYDDTMDYLTATFKGFNTKLVTKVRNGYSIKLTPEIAVNFVKRLVTYISENREMVFDETVKYAENLYVNNNIEGITEEEKEELILELRDGRQDFYDFIDEAMLMLESEELSYYEDMLKGSTVKEEILKEGKSYKQIEQAEVVVENTVMGKVYSKTVITPQDVEKTTVDNIITLDELETLYDVTENRINPVQQVQLQWYSDSSYAQIDKLRLDGKTEWDSQPYSLIENRVYLPLRYIGESFGEEVQWDNENKKAYIIRNNEKIDMTGLLVDSKTMVKIRDFEKLGYKITYEQVEGLSTAVIIK